MVFTIKWNKMIEKIRQTKKHNNIVRKIGLNFNPIFCINYKLQFYNIILVRIIYKIQR